MKLIRSVAILGLVVILGFSVIVIAGGFNSTRYGTASATTATYTNLEGGRVGISAVFATVSALNTGSIYIVHGTVTNCLVGPTAVTKTLSWLDQGSAVPLETNGKLIFEWTASNTFHYVISTTVQ
jgi:hypothetical protein